MARLLTRPRCPYRDWHAIYLRQPCGVDAGGWFCEDCGEYVEPVVPEGD